jgi:hypothetical protein
MNFFHFSFKLLQARSKFLVLAYDNFSFLHESIHLGHQFPLVMLETLAFLKQIVDLLTQSAIVPQSSLKFN